MADAAPKKSKKAKLLNINKIFEDNSHDIAAQYNGYYKSLGNNWEDVFNWMETNNFGTIPAVAGCMATQPALWSCWATQIPAATGISVFFVPSDEKLQYTFQLYDNTYPQNEGAKKKYNAQVAKFNGLLAHGWSCTETKTVMEDGDLKEKEVQATCNDNIILQSLWAYKLDKATDDELRDLAKLKFDFACNKYKVVKVDCSEDKKTLKLNCTGNGENMIIIRWEEGVMGFNWADMGYQGDARKKVGSLRGIGNSVVNFWNSLVEKEMVEASEL